MRRLFLTVLTLAIATLSSAGSLWAMPWGVDKGKSEITFSGVHAGAPFEGRFEDWTANIEFDPAAPENAVVLVTIQTASAKTGNSLYDGTLPGVDWFNVATFPQARFEAFGAEADGSGNYVLNGKLTIRDHTVPVTVAFQANDSEARADSTVTLQRLDFGMGSESDPTGDWVSLEIPVTVKLIAHPSAK
ncbi:MAG: YceI family protein [Kiloniellales bacterium]